VCRATTFTSDIIWQELIVSQNELEIQTKKLGAPGDSTMPTPTIASMIGNGPEICERELLPGGDNETELALAQTSRGQTIEKLKGAAGLLQLMYDPIRS
jgi:hypothetical protein